MNVKTLALFILFLAFGFIAKAEDSFSAISGISKAPEGTATMLNAEGRTEDAKINFGPIQTMWEGGAGKDAICLRLKPYPPRKEKKPLQFALIEDENELDNIKDPSQYEYLSGQERRVRVPNKKDKRAYQNAY